MIRLAALVLAVGCGGREPDPDPTGRTPCEEVCWVRDLVPCRDLCDRECGADDECRDGCHGDCLGRYQDCVDEECDGGGS
jgi:hypothetical protein